MNCSNKVIGDRILSAWRVAHGVTWVQTNSPKCAKRLSKRDDARRVAVGVAGGYLRIYEFQHSLAWATKLIARYTGHGTSANEWKNLLGAAPRKGSA